MMVAFHWNIETLTPSQQKMAEYVERNVQNVLSLTEQEIADILNLSVASVSRFWRAVGYTNIKDFKKQTAQKMIPTPAGKIETLLAQAEQEGAILQSFKKIMNHVELTLEYFSEESLMEAAQLTRTAKKIYIYAQGSSVGLQELLYFRLARYGLNLHLIENSGSEMLEDLLHVTPDDLVIIFFFGRKTLPEEEVIFEEAEEIGFKTLVITDQLVSPIKTQADVTLYGSRGEPWEFHSMVAPTLILEMLVIAVGSHEKDDSLVKLKELQDLRRKYRKLLPR